MNLRKTRTLILNGGDPEQKRQEILEYFHATFTIDEMLYDSLRYDGSYYLRADRLRHPLIFYFGHTAAFYINKLTVARIIDSRINPRFESMFAVGVDEMSWDDLNEAHYDWPTRSEVNAYRDEVRAAVDSLIRRLPLKLPVRWEDPFWVIMMGIEHQRIHLETSSVLIRQLPLDQVCQLPFWDICSEGGEPPANVLLEVPGGKVSLGKTRSHPLYGWDNEYGAHTGEVTSFRASKYLASNREFLQFVTDGGYAEQRWWSDEGWRWLEFSRAKHPLFWRGGESWRLRTMASEVEMPWNWPVEVNFLEAKAFCNWKAAQSGRAIRVPSEDEWHRLHDAAMLPDQPFWESAPGNLNLEYHASPCPVDRFSNGSFFDVVGNVWQWTETPIYPFHGFEVHPWYDDFSTPTFDGRHNLIKGGSWISTGNEATRDARYAFRRHFFQHAGFRYVEGEAAAAEWYDNSYETDLLASQYSDFHYGPERFDVANFPSACSALCLEVMRGRKTGRALDIGCAVGRSSFELARGGFAQVTGLDFSSRFFRLAVRLQQEGCLRYTLPEEGEITSYHEIDLASLGLESTRDRVEFFQADACNLPEKFTGYDLVLAANLIDRLYAPRAFLSTLHERINPGGVLVLSSPYTWLEEFTRKGEWLGGYRYAGEPVWSLDGLKELLTPRFRLLGEPLDIPFVIRETRRKYQHSIAEITVWELI